MKEIISLNNVSKVYKLYKSKQDRFWESISFGNSKRHRDFYALKDINLSINKGEILGVIGPNGAGKSTLLKLITGVLMPTQGNLDVKGNVSALLELGTGFNPEYSGRENIYLNGQINGRSNKEIEENLDEIIEFAQIGEFVDQPIKTYSSGMFARLAFAVAINIKPDILIVDEALSVGDTTFQHKSVNKMKELINSGATVIFVSHDLESVKNLCTRCIYMKSGSVIYDGEPSKVSSMYLKDVREQTFKSIGVEEPKSDDNNTEVIKNKVIDFEEFRAFEESVKSCIRYGTGDALIRNVLITDSKGVPKESFRFDEKIRVELTIEAIKNVSNLNLCILIKNRNGVDVIGTTTFEENINYDVFIANGFKKIFFEFPNRLKHDMTFSVSVTVNSNKGYDDVIVLDHIEIVRTFKSLYEPSRPVWYAYHQDFDITHEDIYED